MKIICALFAVNFSTLLSHASSITTPDVIEETTRSDRDLAELKTFDFDVPVDDFKLFTDSQLVFDNVGAYKAEFFSSGYLKWYPNETFGFLAAAVSGANFASTEYPDEQMVVSCPDGKFDLVSVNLMPLIDVGLTTTDPVATPPKINAIIKSFDKNGNKVGTKKITLDISNRNTPTIVQFDETFERIQTIKFRSNTDNVYFGIDDLKVNIRKACTVV